MPVAIAGSAKKVEALAEDLQLIACAIRFMEFGSGLDATSGHFHFSSTTQALCFLCGAALSPLQRSPKELQEYCWVPACADVEPNQKPHSTQLAAAGHSQFSLPGNRVGLKTTGPLSLPPFLLAGTVRAQNPHRVQDLAPTESWSLRVASLSYCLFS